MQSRAAAFILALALSVPAAAPAAAYERVCMTSRGLFLSDFFVEILDDVSANAGVSERMPSFVGKYNQDAVSPFHRIQGADNCLWRKSDDLNVPTGAAFRVGIKVVGTVSKKEAICVNADDGHGGAMIWPGGDEIENTLWIEGRGTTESPKCNVTGGHYIWPECEHDYEVPGCERFRPRQDRGSGFLQPLRHPDGALRVVGESTVVHFISRPVGNLRVVLDRPHYLDPNGVDEEGTSGLHIAALNNWSERAMLLLEYGADTEIRDADGLTPLALLFRGGHAETDPRGGVLPLLLDAGADPDAAGDDGITPLWFATRAGNTGAVRALIDAGADVDFAHPDTNETALDIAENANHSDIVRALMAVDAARNTTEARVAAVDFKNLNRKDCRGEGVCDTQLHKAVRAEDLDYLRRLLDAGADTEIENMFSETPLLTAASQNHPSMILPLLAGGAEVNAVAVHGHNTYALVWAIKNDFPRNVIQAMLDAGADPDVRDMTNRRKGYTALGIAGGIKGQAWLVRALLDAGADPDYKNFDGTHAGFVGYPNHFQVRRIILDAAGL